MQGYYVCAGRFDAIEGGRRANPGDPDLEEYLAELRSVSQDDWWPFYDVFSPRRVIKNGAAGDLVWGEDCRYRRHFDCVGFVNYCYDIALLELTERWAESPWALSLTQYQADPVIAATTRVAPGALMAGDILTVGNHHIGLFAGDGDGSPGSPGTVVQAADTPVGVIYGNFQPGWDGWFRLSPAAL